MYRKIVLIGPMGAGKTSLGKGLAEKLSWQFYDTDHEVIRRTGVDIAHIFEREGEAGFRSREHQVLEEVLAVAEDAVVACGGGIVVLPENRKLLIKQVLVVFLDVSLERQMERIGEDGNRPLAEGPDKRRCLRRLRDERLKLYEAVADIRIDTDASHFRCSFQRLLGSVRSYLRHDDPPVAG